MGKIHDDRIRHSHSIGKSNSTNIKIGIMESYPSSYLADTLLQQWLRL